jgi:hypothetical protein
MKWDESIQTPEGRLRHAYFQDGKNAQVLTDYGGHHMTLQVSGGSWRLMAEAHRGAGRAWHVEIFLPRRRKPIRHYAFTKDQAIEIMLKESKVAIPHKGMTFTHKHFIDPDDRCHRAKDSRKAVMQITRVTKTKVYYNYKGQDTTGRWHMPREYWEATYGRADA